MKHKIIYLAFLVSMFSACKPEETPMPKRETPPELITTTINMESDYSKQVWFAIEENKVVATNHKNVWDIAFDCRDDVNRLYLNSSMFMKVAKTDQSDFSLVTSANNYSFKPDHPSGAIDSLAFGKNPELNKVYIIDRGLDASGRALGYRKLQITAMDAQSYTIRYAQLDGSGEQTIVVSKQHDYNKIALSLESNLLLSIEPLKQAWDLCFTQYTHIFYAPYMPYLVTGVTINTQKISVAKSESISFEEMDKDKALSLTYRSETDVIGYDWKEYSFDTGSFTVYSNKVYVIKIGETYYKWRFIDFYDQNGVKGNPKFEFMRL